MSDNLKIALLILVLIPLTFFLKKFFDKLEGPGKDIDTKNDDAGKTREKEN